MDVLRREWSNGRVSLQAPVITLARQRDGRGITLVLTAHLGESRYFDELREVLDQAPVVFYEGVRATSDDPGHARDSQHLFLSELRSMYSGIASLGRLSFQGAALAPQASWVNADVTCCELARELRRRGVNMWRQQAALRLLGQVIDRARNGDEGAARTITLALQCGLLAVSLGGVFAVLTWLPSTRGLYNVLNDWRSEHAVQRVLASSEPNFALVYGAAHGPSLIAALKTRGFRETGRDWHTVFTL